MNKPVKRTSVSCIFWKVGKHRITTRSVDSGQISYAKAPDKKRFELRNPDGTANPYYAFAAILMAGIDGIKKEIDPMKGGWGPYDFNLYDLTEEQKKEVKALPTTLLEAVQALEKDHDYLTAGGVFPEALIDQWIVKKTKDFEKVISIPHPAEFVLYYDL